MLLAGGLLPLLTAIVTSPLTARALGVADRGVLTFAVVMSSMVVVVAAAGLPWLSRARVKVNPEQGAAWIDRARRERPFGLLVAVGCYAAVVATSELDTVERLALASLFIVAIDGTIRGVASDVLLVAGRPRSIGIAMSAGALTGSVLVVVMYAAGHLTLSTALLAQTAGQIVQLAVVRRASRPWASMTGVTRLRLRLRERAASWAAQISDAVVARADLLLVGFLGTAHELGLYALASLLSQIAYVLITTTVLWSYVWADVEPPSQRLVRALRLAAAAWWPLALGGVGAGYLLIVPVFGESFEGARHYLVLAALYALMLSRMVPLLNDTSTMEAQPSAASPGGFAAAATVGSALAASVVAGLVMGAVAALVTDCALLLVASIVLERRATGRVTLVPDFRNFIRFAGRIEP